MAAWFLIVGFSACELKSNESLLLNFSDGSSHMFSLPQVQKAFAVILEDSEKKGGNVPSRRQLGGGVHSPVSGNFKLLKGKE